jgi:hypothetical protein
MNDADRLSKETSMTNEKSRDTVSIVVSPLPLSGARKGP